MPILKQLVSHSNQAKRRSRADLTAEMISAPLGDFRHTMHVGRGGDAFGDTSFLSTRSGEAPREPEPRPEPLGPKPGLLSRTFRSSKRSQSINRGDRYEGGVMPSGGSSAYVKNAISLPYLNEDDAHFGQRLPKSISSSPMKRPPGSDAWPANGGGGAVAMATLDPDFDEHNFGELMDLPPSMPRGGGGLKHADSIMSFNIDLGPSMLGDILSVMEKKGWEDDDLGYEEGKGSESGGSPSLDALAEPREAERVPARPPRGTLPQTAAGEPYTPELQARRNHRLDSCSLSSSGSAALDDKTPGPLLECDTDSAKYSSPRGEDDREFSFMDEDEDEIRV
ncbi:unnamed protein product [Lota lota]